MEEVLYKSLLASPFTLGLWS